MEIISMFFRYMLMIPANDRDGILVSWYVFDRKS